MIKIITIRVIIKIGIYQIAEREGHHSEVEVSMDRIIGEDHLTSIIIEMILEETILEKHKIRGQNFRGRYRKNYRNNNFGRCRSSSRERQYLGNFSRNDRSNGSSGSRSRSGSRVGTNRNRIRCFKFKEYDHFTKDCPNLQTEEEPEQIQQMYNLDEEQTNSIKSFGNRYI